MYYKTLYIKPRVRLRSTYAWQQFEKGPNPQQDAQKDGTGDHRGDLSDTTNSLLDHGP